MGQHIDLYDIFNQLKNKNITEEKIQEVLLLASKITSDITELKKHNQNLLFFSCFQDNDNLFKYLSDNYSNVFQNSYYDCIIFTYVNKNPRILKIALDKATELSKEQNDILIERFANNCYRSENVEIVSNWLASKLNDDEKIIFIEKLFKYNNKPFLQHISLKDNWLDKVSKYKTKDENEESLKLSLIRHYNFNKDKQPIITTNNEEIEFKIEKLPKDIKNETGTVIVKKRKTIKEV